jgi:hypothetical protein
MKPEKKTTTAIPAYHRRPAGPADALRALSEDELVAVSGGSFDIGNIVGSIAKAVVPMAIEAVFP